MTLRPTYSENLVFSQVVKKVNVYNRMRVTGLRDSNVRTRVLAIFISLLSQVYLLKSVLLIRY